MPEITIPKRRFELSAKISADTLLDLVIALHKIASAVGFRGVRHRAEASYGGSYIVDVDEDASITREIWERSLEGYLLSLRDSPPFTMDALEPKQLQEMRA